MVHMPALLATTNKSNMLLGKIFYLPVSYTGSIYTYTCIYISIYQHRHFIYEEFSFYVHSGEKCSIRKREASEMAGQLEERNRKTIRSETLPTPAGSCQSRKAPNTVALSEVEGQPVQKRARCKMNPEAVGYCKYMPTDTAPNGQELAPVEGGLQAEDHDKPDSAQPVLQDGKRKTKLPPDDPPKRKYNPNPKISRDGKRSPLYIAQKLQLLKVSWYMY